MKDSLRSHDYLSRWRWLWLPAALLGAVLGMAYYSSQAHPVEYAATATVAIYGPALETEIPGASELTINTGLQRTEEAAVEYVTSLAATIARYSSNPVVIRELVVVRSAASEAWWKPVALGSVIGALLAIAGIYVWEDARAYRRHLYAGT